MPGYGDPPHRPKGPPESHRECHGCKLIMPLDLEHFGACRTGRNGFLRRCRVCQLEERRLYAKTTTLERAAVKPTKFVRKGELCDAADGCFGLAHRVQGARCRHCGLPFAEEPKPEFMLRRHYERAM